MGMRERVSLLGGTVAIDSAPGAGTTVRIMLPVN
jgi:signal transduction histidine kinase